MLMRIPIAYRVCDYVNVGAGFQLQSVFGKNTWMHVGVAGGGIVGLAVARALWSDGHGVTVFEEESRWGAHQTGRNSGVIHSGLYYRPGGLKARLCVAGAASMAAFARERGLPVEISGELVVAVHSGELHALAELERRGIANGVPVRRLEAAQAREYEPSAPPGTAFKRTGACVGSLCPGRQVGALDEDLWITRATAGLTGVLMLS
jgi:L-2-hydroxyglutarate oxidase LhgO